jgi:hypothetical protein
MSASAQIDTGVHASLPVWPLTGYHWSGILHVPNFLLRHSLIDEPPSQLPTQDERGSWHRHKLYLTNLGPDSALTVGTLCVFTPPLSPPTR